jgi:peptidoglycan/xylan/chitin deacetylase (PgdA/CDA1 family)
MQEQASELHSSADPHKHILDFARWLGLFRLGQFARRNSKSVLVLCYHGISKSDEHLWEPTLYMMPEVFRRRLETIRRFGYQVLPLSDALAQLTFGTLSGPTIVLTFDDGWQDFYSQAWPLLREFGFPATVYQTTYYSLYNRPVFDTACSYLLWKGRGKKLKDSHLTGSECEFELQSPVAINRANQVLQSRVRDRKFTGPEKDLFLSQLAEQLNIDFGAFLHSRILHLMNTSELAEISTAGIDVQLHTHRHKIPSNKEQFLNEIQINRDLIESATRKPAVHFCYPNGVYRPELESWLKEAGVLSATTCDPGIVSSATSSMFLPRYTDSSRVSQSRFEAWLSGIGLLESIYRRKAISGELKAIPPRVEPLPEKSAESAQTSPPERVAVRAAGGKC